MGLADRAMILELAEAGFEYYDSNSIFKRTAIEPEEVEIILKHLPGIYDKHLGTGDLLVRSLISAKRPFNPEQLIRLFENSDLNYAIKGGIALSLAMAPTDDISSWIKEQLRKKADAYENHVLLLGLPQKGGFEDVGDMINFLKSIFDSYFGDYFVKVFKRYARKEDIPFLESKLGIGDKKRDKEIQRLIEAVNMRKREYKLP